MIASHPSIEQNRRKPKWFGGGGLGVGGSMDDLENFEE